MCFFLENLERCESLQKLDLTLNFVGVLTDVERLRQNTELRGSLGAVTRGNFHVIFQPAFDLPYRGCRAAIYCMLQCNSAESGR